MSARRTTPNPPPDDDPVPADIDEFRFALVRRIATYMQAWRSCRRPLCRRGKRCAGRVGCASLNNRPQPPARKHPAIMAHLYRRLQDRRAQSLDCADSSRSLRYQADLSKYAADGAMRFYGPINRRA